MRIIKLFLIITAFYIIFLNIYALLDPDEPRYAATSKNMVLSGEYILPIFNGKPRLNKPPLTYWLISISYKSFGINEFSARLPHAILGILLLFFLFLIGKRYINEKSLLNGIIVISSSPFYLFFSRLCNTDMILTFFFSLSLLTFYIYYAENRIGYLIISLILYLFANLAKGPVAYLVPFIVVIFLITEKDFKLFKNIFVVLSVILFSLSSLIWLFFAVSKSGNLFSIESIVLNETIGRMFKGYAHKEPFYFYLLYFPLLFFPWSILFLYRIKILKNFWKDRFLKFNIIWFFTVFIFFTFSKSKLISYILPLSIPFGIILSKILQEIKLKFNVQFKYLILGCVIFFTILELFLIYQKEFYFSFIHLIFITLFILTLLILKSYNNTAKIGIMAIMFYIGLLTFSGKFITDLKSDKFLKYVKFPPNYTLVVFRKRYTGCAFYGNGYIKLDTINEIKKIKKNEIFVVTSKRMLKEFFKNINFKVIMLTKGRVLIKLIDDNIS